MKLVIELKDKRVFNFTVNMTHEQLRNTIKSSDKILISSKEYTFMVPIDEIKLLQAFKTTDEKQVLKKSEK